MDSTRDRPSGIPRMSRLPVPRSSIPKPASNTSPTPPLRSRPSRDSFGGGDLNPPKLRTSTSRDHVRSSLNGNIGLGGRESPLRTATSRHHPRSYGQHIAIPKTRAEANSTHRRLSVPILQKKNFGSLVTEPETARDSARSHLGKDDVLDGSHSQPLPAASPDSLPLHDLDIIDIAQSTETSALCNASASQTPSTHKGQPRPSLSERTMETLAQIPSSPAMNRKLSSFFDKGRSKSRAEDGNSRPGSSHISDGSGRPSSRQGSRPGSSASQDAPETPNNCRTSSMSYKTSLTTIDGTPQRSSATGLAKASQTMTIQNRTSLSSAKRIIASSMPAVLDSVSPSPDAGSLGRTPLKSGSRTMTARPVKPHGSAQGLFKKPSLPAMKSSASLTDQNPTLGTTAWEGSIPPSTTSLSNGPNQAAVLTSRKSSAALREQIAEAKAAKRTATRLASANKGFNPGGALPSMSNEGFDFGVEQEDPFNLRKGEMPGTKVLQQRVASARTTGRLNIAALALQYIPPEVMNMYNIENAGDHGGNWGENVVDLTRLVAADNEIESLADDVFPDVSPASFDEDEEDEGNIFGGLETLDLHGNLLSIVPLGFRRLAHLTSLNLSSNKLENGSLEIISQMPSLRDLKLSKNQLSGPLDPALLELETLEMIDVHGNNISALPSGMERMLRLRILNLNENKLETVPFDSLCKLPLTELSVRKNKLSGTLIQSSVRVLPYLQTLDASANQLTHLVPEDSKISLPAAHTISLSVNRLQRLPDMAGWANLVTLALDENHIASIPESFTTLQKLRHVDLSSNDIRIVPPEIARMQSLTMIRLTGNPLRDRKLISASTDELKEILAGRLEPPPPYQDPTDQSTMTSFIHGGNEIGNEPQYASEASITPSHDGHLSDTDEDFTTPPTSAPQTPTRSRSETVVKDVWFVRPGGLLDLSRSETATLDAETCLLVAARSQVRQIQLHRNPISVFPISLTAFGSTLSFLSLAHTELAGDFYLSELLELPALRELCVMSNQITSLSPLTQFLKAPVLEKIDATLNRITALPANLKQAFPQLSVLLTPNNQISEVDPESARGLKVLDVSSNDIGQLDPRLGLLGGVNGLQRLEVAGNRFRVPRQRILEQGTEATLRWLRGRLPAEEMAAWNALNGEEREDETYP